MIHFRSYISILLLCLLFLTGCSKEDKYYVEIERDGNLSYIYSYDVNETEKENDRMQAILSWNTFEKKYLRTDILVDNNIYNFLFVLPVKTKTDLATLFNHSLIEQDVDLRLYYKQKQKAFSTVFYFTKINVLKNADNYYRYKLYVVSHSLASEYYLNDIKDGTVYMAIYGDNSRMVNRETLEITSNVINISAKEVENVLDSLGIPHERLSFQPEDF